MAAPISTAASAAVSTAASTAVSVPVRRSMWCGCGRTWQWLADWRCPGCGGPWQAPPAPPFDPSAVAASAWSMWRYAAMLPSAGRVSLGEGGTPLVPLELPGGRVLAKLELFAPTGSYKDRGTAVLVNHLQAAGASTLVTDSSGNAGASLAAYAAAAGMAARVYLPAYTTLAKKRQVAALGADMVVVPGSRAAAGEAARQDATGVYTSHAWHPYVLAGLATCAWEIWEQTGGRLPDVVVCPAGQGTLLLGLVRGFGALRAAGLLAGDGPRLVAVQAAACAPLAAAWHGEPPPAGEGNTRAEGIRTAVPVRAAEVLRAVRDSGGAVLRVPDRRIEAAEQDLARAGLLVEPTGAVAVAALPEVRRMFGVDRTVLVSLTGSGLKSMEAGKQCQPL